MEDIGNSASQDDRFGDGPLQSSLRKFEVLFPQDYGGKSIEVLERPHDVYAVAGRTDRTTAMARLP